MLTVMMDFACDLKVCTETRILWDEEAFFCLPAEQELLISNEYHKIKKGNVH